MGEKLTRHLLLPLLLLLPGFGKEEGKIVQRSDRLEKFLSPRSPSPHFRSVLLFPNPGSRRLVCRYVKGAASYERRHHAKAATLVSRFRCQEILDKTWQIIFRRLRFSWKQLYAYLLCGVILSP